ncbi:MAG: hypothetical protein K2J08_10610 [Ruminococcus sp.]|nr:hypothetical protein [Ruminococcus sp.]
MRLKTTRELRILYIKTALRWLLYYIIIFFGFVFMTSGTWLKPIILIPIALRISINNNMYASAVTGAVCGFLIDTACEKLFGYNAIILTVFCIAVSLIFEFFLRNKFVSFWIVSAVLSYIQCWLDYTFYYKIWNYQNAELIFNNYSLRVWAYTVISSVFVWLLLKIINHFLMPKKHFSIEETIKHSEQQNH